MGDIAYEMQNTADFARRRKKRGISITGRTTAGKITRGLGALAALRYGGAGVAGALRKNAKGGRAGLGGAVRSIRRRATADVGNVLATGNRMTRNLGRALQGGPIALDRRQNRALMEAGMSAYYDGAEFARRRKRKRSLKNTLVGRTTAGRIARGLGVAAALRYGAPAIGGARVGWGLSKGASIGDRLKATAIGAQSGARTMLGSDLARAGRAVTGVGRSIAPERLRGRI